MSPFAILCVSALCAADVGDESPAVAEVPPAAVRRGAEARDAYIDVMRRAADRSHPDVHQMVPELVELYVSLRGSSPLPHAEIAGMQRAVELRLRVFRDRLVRERNNAERGQRRVANQKPAAERTRTAAEGEPGSRASAAGGSAEAASAQQLIDLIQNTIEPDSWDVNGGKGRAMFYSPLNVLVIRNTGEVHEQIGGTLGQLRKLAP